jgi:hypothetical protein
MPAIEYGSYYWGVVLYSDNEDGVGETVHLHADAMKIEENGSLTFTSAGRRPAGANPEQQGGGDDKKEGGEKNSGDKGDKDDKKKDDKDKSAGGDAKGMVYVAFAPGTWKSVYAAKLQDGAPASIEHWASFDGKQQLQDLVPANSGASGQPQ